MTFLRILWLGPNYRHRHNHGHELFVDAVARIPQIEVVRYGPGIGPTPACALWDDELDVPKLICRFGPFDAVVVQHIRHSAWENLSDVDLPKIGIVVDYFPRNEAQKNNFFRCHVYDLLTFPERWMFPMAIRARTAWRIPIHTRFAWLPFSVDVNHLHPIPDGSKTVDATVLYSGGPDYPNRDHVAETVQRVCRAMGKLPWVKIVRNNAEKITHDLYTWRINQSRIMVCSNDSFGSVNLRHLEYSACGVPMLSDEAEDMAEMGFVDMGNYFKYMNGVSRTHKDSLESKLRQILEMHDSELTRVGKAARDLVLRRHTTDIRAREFIRMIGGIIDGKSEENQLR